MVDLTKNAVAEPTKAPPGPETAARAKRPLMWLLACAVGIQLCLLWLDRISLNKAIVWPAAETAIRALFAPMEALLGAVREDNTLTREQMKVFNLMLGFLPAFALYLGACGLVMFRLPANDRRVLRLVVCAAVIFRITLVPFPPILETDLHRYVWDGAVSATHVNPYKYAPVEVSKLDTPEHRQLYSPVEWAELETLKRLLQTHPELAAHFPRINHPKIPTIYPPLAQLMFSVAFRIAPGSDVPIKALVALVDLLIVGMIVLLLGELGMNRCQVVIYAWSPLILKEYANTGHYDPLATLSVLVGLHMIVRRVPVLPGIALALGTASKFYPLVVSLVLAPWLGVLGFMAYGATLLMMYIPYLGIGIRVFDGLRAMAADWEFNSSLFAVVENLLIVLLDKGWMARLYLSRRGDPTWAYASDEVPLDAFLFAKVICAAVGFAFLMGLLRRPTKNAEDAVLRGFAATAALVLLSPVSDPWYYAWVMPYVALYPAGSWLYLGGSMVLYYMYFWRYPWGYLAWARPLEYLPFYALLASEHAASLAAFFRAARALAEAPFRRIALELKRLGAGVAAGRPP